MKKITIQNYDESFTLTMRQSMFEPNWQLAFHHGSNGFIMGSTDHYELRIMGTVKIKKNSSLSFGFLNSLGDKAIESFMSEIEELPYYALINKDTKDLKVCEDQLISGAAQELMAVEKNYVTDLEIENYLKLNDKLTPS